VEKHVYRIESVEKIIMSNIQPEQKPHIKLNKLCWFAYLLLTFTTTVFAKVWTYDIPEGEQYSSPDYEVTVISSGKAHRSFVHYSYGAKQYTRYHWNLQPAETRTYGRRGTVSHSAAIFSFSGTVKVRVTIKKNAKHITLPLKSAKILPSSYNIPCTIDNGNTIVFTLDRPEKVVVFPNYEQAWNIFKKKGHGHKPIQAWNSDYATEKNRDSYQGTNLINSLSEGYKNPLIILAHPPETKIPDRNASGTLVVNPGDRVTQAKLDKYTTVWFTPGVHDLSQIGDAPFYQTLVRAGTIIYLEGGSYVMARFKKNNTLGRGPTSIIGRGVISGIKHKWVGSFSEGSQVINIDNLIGITITDRANFGIYGGHNIDDIAMLGAWHGNTDGPDYLDDCVIQNSFLMAHDDNLKLNNNTHAKHIVIWQLANAHAIMVKEMRDHVTFANSVVEDVDILTYLVDPSIRRAKWPKVGLAAIACVTGSDLQVRNFTFRNIRIESPYLFRVIDFYNLDTNLDYTPPWFSPTSESRHTRIDGVTFQTITVKSPVVAYRSLLGSAYEESFSNIRFISLNINGTTVTNKNKDTFFEIEYDKIKGLTFSEGTTSIRRN
jgi:hypothetical protein